MGIAIVKIMGTVMGAVMGTAMEEIMDTAMEEITAINMDIVMVPLAQMNLLRSTEDPANRFWKGYFCTLLRTRWAVSV